MKSIVALISLFGLAHAGLLAAPAIAPAFVNTGASAQYRSQDNIGNYAFGYNEDHATGGTFRREVGGANGAKVGSYGLRDADGRVRIVNYVADDAGFRANIQTNEPGVEPKDPAAVLINKAPVAVAAPAPLVAPVAAPIAAPAFHAAPLAVAAPVAATHYTTSTAHIAAPAHHFAAPQFAAAPYYAAALHAPAPAVFAPAARTSFTYAETGAHPVHYGYSAFA